MYTYIGQKKNRCEWAWIHVGRVLCVCVHLRVCISMYVYISMCVYIHVCIFLCVNIYLCVCVYISMCVYMYVCIYPCRPSLSATASQTTETYSADKSKVSILYARGVYCIPRCVYDVYCMCVCGVYCIPRQGVYMITRCANHRRIIIV